MSCTWCARAQAALGYQRAAVCACCRQVLGLYSSKGGDRDLDGETTGVVVCTIEKANALILRLMESESMGMLSTLIVDELHMVRTCTGAPGNELQMQGDGSFYWL